MYIVKFVIWLALDWYSPKPIAQISCPIAGSLTEISKGDPEIKYFLFNKLSNS